MISGIKRIGAAALIAAFCIPAAGCQGKVSSQPQEVTASAVQTAAPEEETQVPAAEETAETMPESSGVWEPQDYAAAVELVLGEYPGALPLQCSLDHDSGALIWEVKVLAQDGREYEAEVDAQSGSLLRAYAEDDTPDIQAAQITVPYNEAVDLALAANSGCTFESFELEPVSGAVFYEIELRTAENREVRVNVNAATGEMIAAGSAISTLAGNTSSSNSAASAAGNGGAVNAAPGSDGYGHHGQGSGHHAEYADYDDYDDYYDYHD